MTAGTAIANGTAIPAVSRTRNSTIATMNWTSTPMRVLVGRSAKTSHVQQDRAADRKAQRGCTDRHHEPRYPEWRLEHGWRALTETPRGELEPDIMPHQQG